jgi:hypothetical protein
MASKVGDRVLVPGIGTGVVTRIGFDDRGEAINKVTMDGPTDVTDGYFLARDCELKTAPSTGETV